MRDLCKHANSKIIKGQKPGGRLRLCFLFEMEVERLEDCETCTEYVKGEKQPLRIRLPVTSPRSCGCSKRSELLSQFETPHREL